MKKVTSIAGIELNITTLKGGSADHLAIRILLLLINFLMYQLKIWLIEIFEK